MNKRVLVVVAHPDDEVLGCGGTVARLVRKGFRACTLILGSGITSRNGTKDIEKEKVDLHKHANKANRIIGASKVIIRDFPDNKFDSVPMLDIVKVIEQTIETIRPAIVFTHFEKDLNVDHQITYRAILTATRPLNRNMVKEIYSFEVLSSTEWNYPLSFLPDVFFDIENTIRLKLRAMREYKGELREFPHPRSLKGIELNAQYWGMRVNLKFVEAFKNVKKIL